MDKQNSKKELIKHKEKALQCLDNYIMSLINSNNVEYNSKADKLSYWIESYSKYLQFEPSFKPNSFKKYKRGDIVQINLGYRIGSEEGGLHYAVVVDNDNSIYNPILTVIPLTSIKSTKDLDHLHSTEINLGDTLYTQISQKAITKKEQLRKQLLEIEESLIKIADSTASYDILVGKASDLKKSLAFINKIDRAIAKMKVGSIALVNQITTISKIRIYDPVHNFDVLHGIKLSPEQMDSIDDAILASFTKKQNLSE